MSEALMVERENFVSGLTKGLLTGKVRVEIDEAYSTV